MALYVDKIAQTVPSDVKKLISLLLAGVMTFSLAACGDTTASSTDNSNAGETKAPVASVEETATEVEENSESLVEEITDTLVSFFNILLEHSSNVSFLGFKNPPGKHHLSLYG